MNVEKMRRNNGRKQFPLLWVRGAELPGFVVYGDFAKVLSAPAFVDYLNPP